MRHERGVEQRIFELVDTVPPDSLLSPLRDLARDELAAGHDREGLIEDFEHVRSALREKELEEQEDVVMEVMDFLYGWCAPQMRIPAPSVPSPTEPPSTSVGQTDPLITGELAAQRFADTLAESYRIVYEQAAEARERQGRLAQDFSERVMDHLKDQVESGRAAYEMAGQARRQQEAGRAFARESVDAYLDFLDTAFSQYREGTQRAAGSAQEGARVGSQAVSDVVGIAAGVTRDAAESAAGQPPIEGYDELNVDEIAQRLEGLSPEKLDLIRAYERRNKNRATLLEQIDRKLGGIS